MDDPSLDFLQEPERAQVRDRESFLRKERHHILLGNWLPIFRLGFVFRKAHLSLNFHLQDLVATQAGWHLLRLSSWQFQLRLQYSTRRLISFLSYEMLQRFV